MNLYTSVFLRRRHPNGGAFATADDIANGTGPAASSVYGSDSGCGNSNGTTNLPTRSSTKAVASTKHNCKFSKNTFNYFDFSK